MRNKKLFAAAMAGALVVAQMATPVMAADNEVTDDITVTTKSGVIRVVLPTAMEIAVDQFETMDAGTQIYSTSFVMENRSSLNVEVAVESTATLGGSVALLGDKAAVDSDTTTTGKAWLGVAAATSGTVANNVVTYNFDDTKTTKVTESLSTLSDKNANVATFDATSKKASQTFYLGQTAGGTTTYKLDIADASAKLTDANYANEKIKLTAETMANDAALKTAVADHDVYVIVTADATKKGTAVTKIAKGTAEASIPSVNSSNSYYKADAGAVAANDLVAYAEVAAAAGDNGVARTAAFRYVGKLNEAKTGGWTKDDITKVSVKYTINGVTASTYGKKAPLCTAGLYRAPLTLTVAASGSDAGSASYTWTDAPGTNKDGLTKITVDGVDFSKHIQALTFTDTATEHKLFIPKSAVDLLKKDAVVTILINGVNYDFQLPQS